MANLPRPPLFTPGMPTKAAPGLITPVNLLLTTLAVVVTSAPFTPDDTSTQPRPQPAVQTDTSANTPLTARAAVPSTFGLDDWPCPRGPWPLTQPTLPPPNPVLTAQAPVPTTFGLHDWPCPRGPWPLLQPADPPNLVLTARSAVPSTFGLSDWPSPRGPWPLLQLPDPPNPVLTTRAAVPVTFGLYGWPCPRGPWPLLQPPDPPNLILTARTAVPVTFGLSDWPTPRPIATVQPSLPPNPLTLTLASPFSPVDAATLRAPTPVIAVDLPPNLILAARAAVPSTFGCSNWPVVPARLVTQLADPPNLLSSTLAAAPAAPPFTPITWPLAKPSTLVVGDQVQNPLVLAPTVAPPFTAVSWPTPQLRLGPQLLDPPNLLQGTLAPAPASPFLPVAWWMQRSTAIVVGEQVQSFITLSASPTVPFTPTNSPTLRSSVLLVLDQVQNLAPLTAPPLPFYQTDWHYSTKVWQLQQPIALGSPLLTATSTVPSTFGLSDWPVPGPLTWVRPYDYLNLQATTLQPPTPVPPPVPTEPTSTAKDTSLKESDATRGGYLVPPQWVGGPLPPETGIPRIADPLLRLDNNFTGRWSRIADKVAQRQKRRDSEIIAALVMLDWI